MSRILMRVIMKAYFLSFLLALLDCVLVCAACGKQDPCEHFYRALKRVPHEKLIRADGEYESLDDGKKRLGCEVTLVTNNALLSGIKSVPDFNAEEGTDLYRDGWRRNLSYDADGPGTSMHGIERGDDLCLISRAQPASIEAPYIDGQGTFVQSETLTVIVQCRKK